jgi:hypothetical protein
MSNAYVPIERCNAYATASDAALSEITSFPSIEMIIHENAVPQIAGEILDKLYGSIFSTLDHFQVGNELDGVSTYIAKRHGDIKALLLYRRDHGVVTVLNQLISLDADEIQRFADTLFERDASISTIVLTAVRTNARLLRYPSLCFSYTEDIVAELPSSNEIFLARLGKNMRETVNRYTRRVQRTFPSFCFEVYTDSDIDTAQAYDIYRLHQARMHVKKKQSDVNATEFDNILALMRRRGLMTVATIDGKVAGGLMCWCADKNYFMRIIAHDPTYDGFKLGSVCCYLTMKECIARGGATFHFLFGRTPYKYRFLGIDRRFDHLVIYRSRLAMVRHGALACQTAFQGMNREARIWLQNAERGEDWLSHVAADGLRLWRRFKQRSERASP